MTLAQLESDLRAKKTAIKDLIARTTRACQETVVRAATATEPEVRGRLMTTEEKGAIEAACTEGEAIQTRIDGMRSDADVFARVDRLRDSAAGSASAAAYPLTHPASRLSIGQQFVGSAEYREAIRSQLHRKSGAWSTPQIECSVPWGAFFHATTLTEDPASGGALVHPDVQPGFIELLQRQGVVADLIAPGTTGSNLVQYTKEKTFTNAADMVKEGTAKPESTLVFEPASAPVRKVAHWIPSSEEMLEDAPQTQSVIDSRLRLGLALKEEDELLNGTGVDPHLLGLNKLPGLTPALPMGTDTIADAMLKQITIIATSTFIYPDGWVMNPNDWLIVQIAKNANGNYMGSGPFAPPQAPMLWGLRGVVTPAEVVGEALVGAFRSMSQIFRRGGVRVEASNSHVDFFVKNLVAIRGEERLAFAVYREAAFGKVTALAATPSAPTAASARRA